MRGGTAFFCACKLLLRLLFHVDRKGLINGRNAMENHLPFVPRAVGRKLHLHLPTILGDRKGIPFPEARQVPSANVSIRNASSSTNFVVPHLLSVSGMVTLNNDQALPKGFPSRLSTLTVCSPPAADSDNSVDRTSYSSFRECEPSQPGKNKSAHITLATIVETDFIISN